MNDHHTGEGVSRHLRRAARRYAGGGGAAAGREGVGPKAGEPDVREQDAHYGPGEQSSIIPSTTTSLPVSYTHLTLPTIYSV